MKILLFSDPHLGLNRTTNTTPASRLKLQNLLYEQALDIVKGGNSYKVCCGDLFDSYSNNEQIIQQGLNVARNLHLCIAGNHDYSKIKNHPGSFEFLQNLMKCNMQSIPYGKAGFIVRAVGNVRVFSIPHVITQDLFEESIRLLMQENTSESILLLHCDYDVPWDMSNTSLILTKELAEKLSHRFQYIFIGHKHVHYAKGNIRILGNTFPTGFADINDKYVTYLDDWKLRTEQVWDKAENYIKVNVNDLPEQLPYQFIDIVGEWTGNVRAVSKRINSLWKYPDVLAIRSNYTTPVTRKFNSHQVNMRIEDLSKAVSKDLKTHNQDLYQLWQEMQDVD